MTSRTTTERIVRNLLVTVLVIGFAIAFLWDGYVRYAKNNARQLVKSLGLDASVLPAVDPKLTSDEANRLVQRIYKGTPAETVTGMLGKPQLSHGEDVYYLGPGGHLRVHLERGRVESVEWRDGVHTETDLAGQRYLGYVLGVIGIGLLVRLARVCTLRVSLSEAGLKITGKPLIPFEAVSALQSTDVKSGRRIELEYSLAHRRGRIRLDDYVVKDFDVIVAAICERTGLPNPYRSETPGGAHSPGA